VLRLPATYTRSLICFASRPHAILLASCLATCAPGGVGGTFLARIIVHPATQSAGLFARGRKRDLPGSQVIRSMPLPRSSTPAESTTPCHLAVSSMLPPRFPRQGLQRLMNFEAQSRGFNICCLRFTNGVATTHARLASGWLARLCREGVQPSGSRQKVSVRLILLFWIYPGAKEVSLPSFVCTLVCARSA
jgi:hypothetical protein